MTHPHLLQHLMFRRFRKLMKACTLQNREAT